MSVLSAEILGHFRIYHFVRDSDASPIDRVKCIETLINWSRDSDTPRVHARSEQILALLLSNDDGTDKYYYNTLVSPALVEQTIYRSQLAPLVLLLGTRIDINRESVTRYGCYGYYEHYSGTVLNRLLNFMYQFTLCYEGRPKQLKILRLLLSHGAKFGSSEDSRKTIDEIIEQVPKLKQTFCAMSYFTWQLRKRSIQARDRCSKRRKIISTHLLVPLTNIVIDFI